MPKGEPGTVEEEYPHPPAGWRLEMRGGKIVTYRHAERGLEVIVRAVYSASKHRPGTREPAHFVVRLHDGGLTRQPGAHRDRSAKAETRSEAFQLARSFMEEVSAATP